MKSACHVYVPAGKDPSAESPAVPLKETVPPALYDADALIDAVVVRPTMTVALALVLAPPAVTVSVATYDPLAAYECCGLAVVAVEPSPKFHEYESVLVFPKASVEPFEEN